MDRTVSDLLQPLFGGVSGVRRLALSGVIRLNGEVIEDPFSVFVNTNDEIRIGKRYVVIVS